MKRAWLLACLLPLACSQGKPPSSGEAYYKALNCRACHMIGAEGAGRGGPDLTMVGFRRTPAWLDRWLKDPQAWKADTLMPNPHLNEKSREALVEYLAGLKGEAWGGRKPWSEIQDRVERGHVLYAKAGCVACHGRAGLGGYPNNNVAGGKIPALSNVAQTYTKEELARKIAKGVYPQKADPKGEDPLVRMPMWSEVLSADEIGAVAEYLFTLKPSGPASGSDW
jgi:mono/diheme cytochrome c family protein